MKAIPSPETITPTTPLRLDVAARLAFPDGSMGVSGLRNEINKGNLPAEKIAGRLYISLAGIEEMRRRCAVQKVPSSTSANQGARAASAGGLSSTEAPTAAAVKSAQAHLQAIAQGLKKRSPTTSPKNMSRPSAEVIPIKS
jgi:hypothetical protein